MTLYWLSFALSLCGTIFLVSLLGWLAGRSERRRREESAQWMFDEHDERTLAREHQLLATALARQKASVLRSKPARRLFAFLVWLSSRMRP